MTFDSEQCAINLTIAGIEGIIRHKERALADITRLDALHGEQGREAREAAIPTIKAKLAGAREALRIRREAGGR
jgi:hypothetical protein